MQTRILSTAAVALLALAGCAHDAHTNDETHLGSPNDPHDTNAKVPSIEANYEMVGIGKPPLSFMVSSGGWIKLIDATDNTIIHSAQIPPTNGGLLIRLDPDAKAVTYSSPVGGADNAKVAQSIQPINPDHRFELYYQR